MKLRNILECERNQLYKMMNYQLPNKFIWIGIWIFILSFLSMTVLKFFDFNKDSMRTILRSILLISLLVISIARDKEEDEMIKLMRMQSYALAFIIGVLYAVFQPVINYIVANVKNSNTLDYTTISEFEVLLFMLLIQLMFFNYLKKMR
ncbi:MAG: hypothetical protein L3J34_05385 [Flavobacteriaceae bacterium]|nr:hypothetical protein [Flavobacteriaceae bacterium]